MSSTDSCQDVYAANLESPLGVAIFHPIPFRTETGRVGDIGFFHHNGEYEWIRSAFDSEVTFPNLTKGLIVRVYRIKNGNGHLIIMMSERLSSSKYHRTFGSLSGEMPRERILKLELAPKYRHFQGILLGVRQQANIRITIGGQGFVQLTSETGSLSVLVPGQGPLTYRACVGRAKDSLIKWFISVEDRAWEYVNAVFGDSRPSTIFLVTGQTMTSEYWICHKQDGVKKCHILLEPGVGIPQILDATVHAGYQFERATAYLGFNIVHKASEDHSRLFSIYLQHYASKPRKRIAFEPTRSSRLEKMFK
jgi:hypothetical protein